HTFGNMLGTERKPFNIRAGGTVKLAALLDEAL
ncbi:arginine--tRNA ligase, partial [Mycobacterium tuberculosis]|nr:arginine--tRNA ligase [Mycobacterium tuberculosis]